MSPFGGWGKFHGARLLVPLNLSISADGDDGYDAAPGWVAGTDDIIVGLAVSSGSAGLRFTGVNIPAGAKIISADLQIQVNATNSGGGLVDVRGRDVNNAGAWDPVLPSTMDVTTAKILRTLATIQRESFDVKDIVQEIVDNNAGTGSGLAFGLLDNSSPSTTWSLFDAREKAGSNEATLDTVYLAPA